MSKYTAQDIFDLENSLKSSGDILSAQERLFGADFRETLAKLTEILYNLDYTTQEIHRHGVLLGILLAEQRAEKKKVSYSDWE